MLSTIHRINADLDKKRKRTRLLRLLGRRAVSVAAAACTSPQALDRLCDRLIDTARQAADLPVYDAERLRLASTYMTAGCAVAAAGTATAWWAYDLDGIASVVLVGVGVLAALGGAIAAALGHSLRARPHLPWRIELDGPSKARQLLDQTGETARPSATVFGRYTIYGLCFFDATLQLGVSLPLMQPSLTPVEQFVITLTGSALVSHLIVQLVDSVARAATIASKRAAHAALSTHASPESIERAATLRGQYQGLIASWPLRKSWVWTSTILQACLLGAVQTLLITFRFLAPETDSGDLVLLGLAAAIGTLALFLATKTAASSYVLTDSERDAKQLLAIYPTDDRLRCALAADRAVLNSMLNDAERVIRSVIAPSTYGDASLTCGRRLVLPDDLAYAKVVPVFAAISAADTKTASHSSYALPTWPNVRLQMSALNSPLDHHAANEEKTGA